MPKSARPRKRYRPHGVRADAHLHAIDRSALLLPRQKQDLTTPMHAALDAFRRGAGSVVHWSNLADACNVGQQLAHMRIGGGPLLPCFAAAEQALAAVHARHAQRRSWTLRGTELAALDECAYWHAWQLGLATQGELHDAILTVKRRSAGALAGSVGADTIVCVGLLGSNTQETTTWA